MADGRWPGWVKCDHCDKEATCFGAYEGITAFACDDCCGHGNEDGHCEQLGKVVLCQIRDHAKRSQAETLDAVADDLERTELALITPASAAHRFREAAEVLRRNVES